MWDMRCGMWEDMDMRYGMWDMGFEDGENHRCRFLDESQSTNYQVPNTKY